MTNEDVIKEVKRLVESQADNKSSCPHCGYCQHCGRGGHYNYPTYPTYPMWPTGPTWIWSGTTTDAPMVSGQVTTGMTYRLT